MAQKIRFGLTLSNRGVMLGAVTSDDILDMAEMAESSGMFEHLWVGDSLMAKPRMESIIVMAGLAARTKRLKIGPACMATFPQRNPIVLAYQWASLDLMSNGRMIMAACMGPKLSLGYRWVDRREPAEPLQENEYTNMGVTVQDRAARMVENVKILRMLWTQDRVTYEGRFHTLTDAFIEPKPVQSPPPIWMTGNPNLEGPENIAERNLRRIARLGDGWMTTAAPDKFGECKRRIFEYAKDYDRSFEDLPCFLYYRMNIGEDKDAIYKESKKYLDLYYHGDRSLESLDVFALGTPEHCIEKIQAAIDGGATDITLMFPSWSQKDQFKRLIEEVLPTFL